MHDLLLLGKGKLRSMEQLGESAMGTKLCDNLEEKDIGTDLKGCVKNYLKCGCIPTRYYGAQIFLGTKKPTDYTKVRVYRRTSSGKYTSAYKTIDVRYAKYVNGPFGKGYYLDYSLSKVCLSRGTYYFAIQAVGSDGGKEITGPMKEIGCAYVNGKLIKKCQTTICN